MSFLRTKNQLAVAYDLEGENHFPLNLRNSLYSSYNCQQIERRVNQYVNFLTLLLSRLHFYYDTSVYHQFFSPRYQLVDKYKLVDWHEPTDRPCLNIGVTPNYQT